MLLSPGVLAAQLVLVAPVCGCLGFLTVFPQEGHGSLEILVRLQAEEKNYQSGSRLLSGFHLRDDSVKSSTDTKPLDRGVDDEQDEQSNHSARWFLNTSRAGSNMKLLYLISAPVIIMNVGEYKTKLEMNYFILILNISQ